VVIRVGVGGCGGGGGGGGGPRRVTRAPPPVPWADAAGGDDDDGLSLARATIHVPRRPTIRRPEHFFLYFRRRSFKTH